MVGMQPSYCARGDVVILFQQHFENIAHCALIGRGERSYLSHRELRMVWDLIDRARLETAASLVPLQVAFAHQ